ncbi:hypothetical protein FB451DRAFT_464725 [Mycena latifolia]|nr:hypothetical protein FB451DRAFT_464725 [Mycena latifolia]
MPAFEAHYAHAHGHAPPSPAGSSSSDNSASTGPPRTPVSASPTLPLTMPTFMNFTGEDTLGGVTSLGGAKRTSKTTRRVNTAERRATHNAVERQRRETLNSRFLDLAALLSNLHQIRRPSKSAIVNSSIAHLNASRRHRALAAQQLRMLKSEADALRREVNEWRARAGVSGAEEPPRGDAFSVVLRGELEFEAGDMLEHEHEAEEGDEDEEAGGAMYGGRQYAAEPAAYVDEDYARQQHALLAAQQMQAAASFAHTGVHPPAAPHPHPHSQYTSPPAHYYTPEPTIAHPAPAFENPAMGMGYEYDYAHHHPGWAYEKQHMLHAQQQQAAW